MIGASRRQRDDARSDAFDLHERLAGREAWHRKLTSAGVAALVASVAAWLADASFSWHAAVVAAAFSLGLARPVAGARERALGWIAERAGLAYETALAEGVDDPYGFRAAVVERARSAAVRVRPPSRRPWWLVAAAVALGLLVLPAAQLARPNVGTTTPAETSEPSQPATPEPFPEQDPLVPPEERDDEARAEDSAGDGGDRDDGAGADAAPGGASDQETLSRFLENLRERDPFRPLDPPSEDGSDPSQPPARDVEGERSPGEGRAPGDPREPAAEGREPSEPSAGEGERGEGEREGQEGVPEEGAEEGREEGAPGSAAGEDAPPQDGETPTEGVRQGEDEGQPGPDAADGVGDAPSSVQPSEAADAASQQEPEFLPGELGRGPERPGGTVLLPGEDDIDVPPGLRRDTYRRAVEEAVTDGRVPLEYQEIIRNYFR